MVPHSRRAGLLIMWWNTVTEVVCENWMNGRKCSCFLKFSQGRCWEKKRSTAFFSQCMYRLHLPLVHHAYVFIFSYIWSLVYHAYVDICLLFCLLQTSNFNSRKVMKLGWWNLQLAFVWSVKLALLIYRFWSKLGAQILVTLAYSNLSHGEFSV